MTAHPMALSAAMSIGNAARAMRERDVGDVIVVDDQNALYGIVTDRDIVVRAVADDRNPSEVRIGDICSQDLDRRSSASVKDAVKLMREQPCGACLLWKAAIRSASSRSAILPSSGIPTQRWPISRRSSNT